MPPDGLPEGWWEGWGWSLLLWGRMAAAITLGLGLSMALGLVLGKDVGSVLHCFLFVWVGALFGLTVGWWRPGEV